jgi:hypothetical protein
MKRLLILIVAILILLCIVAGGFLLKGILPSTVTITSINASRRLCVEADFGGHVDAHCFGEARKITLSSRMKRDDVIYLTLKQEREVSRRSEVVYAGRHFPIHCDVSIGRAGEFDKTCRSSIYADLLRLL